MIAAVTARAFDVVARRAPDGVAVRRLPDGCDAATFVLPDWRDRETLDGSDRRLRLDRAFGVTVIGVSRNAREGVHATGELSALARFARGEPLRNVVREAT